jgi:hypothetical protein
MKRRSRRASWLGYVVFALGAAASSVVWGNGQEFFDPGADGKVDLVYVGRVRDVNGRFLRAAEVVIWSPQAGMTFPAVTDASGHYSSPDVGASLKETGAAVDPKELQVTCALPGYELVKPAKLPTRTQGRVNLDFVLRPVGSAAAAAPERSQSRGLIWLVPGLLVLTVIGAAVRK